MLRFRGVWLNKLGDSETVPIMLKHTKPNIIDTPAGEIFPFTLAKPVAPGVAVAEERSVIVLTYPGCFLGETIRLLELMTSLNSGQVIRYVPLIYSLTGGEVASPSSKLIHVDSLPLSDPIPIANDLLIITHGILAAAADPGGSLSRWLQAVCPRSKRIVALGSGVLRLAAAGLVNHRHVTIHSALIPFLAANFPLVDIDASGSLQIDGNLFTTNEHLDLYKLALRLIKSPVSLNKIQPRTLSVKRNAAAGVFKSAVFARKESVAHRIALWWLIHLGDDLTMKDSADFLAMSERSFRRHFKCEVGYNPYLFLLLLRLELARQALIDGDLPIDKIARRGGLHDGQQLARMFRKFIRTSPNQYRAGQGHKNLPVRHPLYAAMFNGCQTPCWLRELLDPAHCTV